MVDSLHRMSLLESERVLLREFELADFTALHEFVSLPEVCRYTDWGPNAPADTSAFLAQATKEAQETHRQGFSLAVVRKDDRRLIGSCAVWQESAAHARGALGFVFHPDVWRQGFATEVAPLLLGLGFGHLGLERIEATCRPDNIGSAKALEGAGLVQEGLLRKYVIIRGQRRDSLIFAALRS